MSHGFDQSQTPDFTPNSTAEIAKTLIMKKVTGQQITSNSSLFAGLQL